MVAQSKRLAGLVVLGIAMCVLSYKFHSDGDPPRFVWLTGVVGGLALLLAIRDVIQLSRSDGL